jgi:hypothetical protein
VGDLKTTLVDLDYGSTRLCFGDLAVRRPLPRRSTSRSREALADVLKLTPQEVVAASSHDHTDAGDRVGSGCAD